MKKVTITLTKEDYDKKVIEASDKLMDDMFEKKR